MVTRRKQPAPKSQGGRQASLSALPGVSSDTIKGKFLPETAEGFNKDWVKACRLLLENQKDIFFVVSPDGYIRYSSPAMDFGGYDAEKEIGEHFSKYIASREDLQRATESMKDMVVAKKTITFRFLYKPKNRKPFPAEATAKPVIEAGKVTGISGVLRDISERVRAEEALSRSESRFRAIFDNMASAVAIYEPMADGEDFRLVDFNRSAEKLEKIKKAEVLGKAVTEVFPGVKEFGLLEVFKKVNRNGKPVNHPVSFYEDGRISGWRDNYVYKLSGGEIIAIYNDVTEEKKRQEKLERQNSFLNTIISSLSHPFYVVDARNYSLVIANEAALQGRGLEGLTCYNISHKTNKPCNSAEHGCTLEIVRQTKKPTTLEHIHFDRDGKPKFVDVHGYPIFDEQGEVMQMIEYCIDVSERKRMEIELEEKNKINKCLLENAPFGVYVVNGQGGIDYVNPAMLSISGTPREHFMELNMFEHIFYKKIGLAEKIKNGFSGEKFKMDNIKYTSQFARKTTVRNFIGMPVGEAEKRKVLVFVEDITQIDKTKEEIQKRVQELEKFNKIAVDREIRMVELKKKIKELQNKP